LPHQPLGSESALEAFFAEYIAKEKLPGVSVCVRKGGREVWKQAFGLADSRGTPMTTDTVFGIASMSKGLTCAAFLLQETAGRASFLDPVSKYLPVALPGVPEGTPLVHHLATHTAGLPPLPLLSWSIAQHSDENRGYTHNETAEERKARREKLGGKAEPVGTLEDLLAYINRGAYPLLGQPGYLHSYSNDSFALLSYIVDQAAGKPLEDVLADDVFAPLGMAQSVLDADYSQAAKLGPLTEAFSQVKDKDAEGKDIPGSEHFVSDTKWDLAPPYRGAGWCKSTPSDMARFYETLMNGGVFEGKTVLPGAETLYGARFPELPDTETFCYGLVKRPFHTPDGKTVYIVEHSGGLHGVSTKGGFVKGGDVAACVFCNWEEAPVTPLLNAVFSHFLGYAPEASHFYWPMPGHCPKDAARYAGVYKQTELFSDPVEISYADGKLYAKQGKEDAAPVALVYCGRSRFLKPDGAKPPERCDRYEFFLDENGHSRIVRVGSRAYLRE